MNVWWSALVIAQLLGPAHDRTNEEGNEAYQDGELDEALKNYTQAQVEHPESRELHYNIGNVQFRKDELDKALEEYNAALDAEPELKRRSHFNVGNVRYSRDWAAEALYPTIGTDLAPYNVEKLITMRSWVESPENMAQIDALRAAVLGP